MGAKLRTLMAVVACLLTCVWAAPVSADDVINDDLIVIGSACVGLDCVNGETFGFDTIRVKENNVRINFDDTSTTDSFPKNDWTILVNDSDNGGLDRFSIQDVTGGTIPFTIEKSVRSNALYVESDGDIGIGTNNPVVDIHVVTGNTPTLRLDQDGSAGFTPQVWDLAGNETNLFIRDVTNGSRLPFRIRPNAPTSSIDVAASGNVGFGTSSPNTALDVFRSGAQTTVDFALRNESSDWRLQNFNDLFRVTLAGTGISEVELNNAGLLKLQNDGTSEIGLINTTSTADWRLQNFNDNFRISKAGTGNAEMTMDGSGNVTFLGVVSANNGGATLPDYVFEPDYKLLPLPELKSFVEKNKHLPKIPSKSEVEANGGTINMSQMQYDLLEKIEELTLYTIQQETTINDLKARLDSLEVSTKQE